MQNHFTSAVCTFIFPSLFIENILHKLVHMPKKRLLHMLRETPVEIYSLYILKAMLHSLERHLHLFVLLFLFIIHFCFG